MARGWRGDPGLLDAWITFILLVWQWLRLSDSRWISLGASCRALLCSLLLGIKAIVEEITRRHGAITYYITGTSSWTRSRSH